MGILSNFRAGHKLGLAVMAGSFVAGQLVAAAPPDQARLVAANTAFAFALMNQVAQAQPGANVFISPFSVSSVMQMVNNGAAGETKREIQQALHTDGLTDGALNGAFRALDRQWSGRPDVILNLANGLWVQQGFALQPAFVKENQDFFQAELANVDFAQPQTAKTINDWANRKTQGKIPTVVAFPFPALTHLVLANAIYFKGTWVVPFQPENTRPLPFHPANGEARPVPMMTQAGSFSYLETPDFQAVRLPYRGGLQMELYLPAPNSSPQPLLARLAGNDPETNAIPTQFARREGAVTLPKFKLNYAINLNKPLQALGMKSAFTSSADFSGIASEKLWISLVKQNGFVAVNEQGTEAAAVTVVAMRAAGLVRPPPDRFKMILDRPFLFAISDVDSGSILFMGIVNDPTVQP